jgi:hypothetical protein
MAESSGVPCDVLAWTAEWYFRAYHRLPMTQAFGTGTQHLKLAADAVAGRLLWHGPILSWPNPA